MYFVYSFSGWVFLTLFFSAPIHFLLNWRNLMKKQLVFEIINRSSKLILIMELFCFPLLTFFIWCSANITLVLSILSMSYSIKMIFARLSFYLVKKGPILFSSYRLHVIFTTLRIISKVPITIYDYLYY